MKKYYVLILIAIFLLLSTVANAISFISMTQWSIADGGNDHWYGLMVDQTMGWYDASDSAFASTINGNTGYLATITSPAEDDFIYSSLVSGVSSPDIYNEFWLGGYLQNDTWSWMTGESWSYTNWDQGSGEPRGGHHLAIRGDDTPPIGGDYRYPSYWNDAELTPHLWSVVEWGTYNPSPLPGDRGYISEPASGPNPEPVPEPATMFLFGLGLIGMRIVRKFKNSKQTDYLNFMNYTDIIIHYTIKDCAQSE